MCGKRLESRRDRLGLCESVLVNEARGLRAVLDAEFAVHVVQMELDRLLGYPELLGDGLVGKPACDGEQDGVFARGQSAVSCAVTFTGTAERHRVVDVSVTCLAERRRQITRI